MKVCMVAYAFYESDSRIRQYTESLVRRGDSVDVIALRKKGQKHFEELKGVNVYRIQKRTVGEKRKLSYLFKILLFLLKSSIFLTRKHLRNHYELIHVHSVPDFEVFAAWWPKLTGAKIILDIHDVVPELYASKFNASTASILFKSLVLAERVSTRFSDHVIVANHIWRKTLISRSVAKEKCTVCLNYPDQAVFFKKERGRNNGKFILIYPGTLNWHQGVDIAIEAVAAIVDQMPDVEFQIYGEGPERERLIRQVAKLGLNGKVVFKDLVPMETIAEMMANANMGIEPKRAASFGDEAFSTKIPEFLALGIPVIASDTKIHKFYLNDSIVRFFRSDDPADLAESISVLRRRKHVRNELIQNGLKFTEQNNWEKKQWDYLGLVDQLAGLHPSSGQKQT